MAGILDVRYHRARVGRSGLRYRLKRRIAAIEDIITRCVKNPKGSQCLEVGAADGLLLSRLNKTFEFKQAVGLELSEELIKANKDPTIHLRMGNAEELQFPANAFDIVIATAVIEHLDHPVRMVAECCRVLRKGGMLILTAPNPLHDAIAKRIGYLKEEVHINSFTMKQLVALLEEHGFEITESKNFILCPFFTIPFEQSIEEFLRFASLSWLLVNHLVVGRK